MRAFVALEVSKEKVLDEMVSFQKMLAETGAELRLVDRQNLHFTLKFLGDITEEQAADADRRLRELALNGSDVRVRGAGAFPGLSRPRVVWAGVDAADRGKVVPIALSVIAALEGIGETDARPFEPHITLARMRSDARLRELVDLLRSNSDRDFGSVRLETFALKSSSLGPTGASYTNVGVYGLN